MREQAINAMRNVIREWYNKKLHVYELKRVLGGNNQLVNGELLMHFSVELNVRCNGSVKEIREQMDFRTLSLTLPIHNINPEGDAILLRQQLSAMDDRFYSKVQEALDECSDELSESVFLPL